MFKSNCSLHHVNLRGSINDETAKKVVSGLHRNPLSRIMKLGLDEHSFTISTLECFLSLIKPHSQKLLEFSDISISRTKDHSDKFWLDAIKSSLNPLSLTGSLRQKPSKLFLSLCKHCFQNNISVSNVTHLEVEVDHNDTAVVAFSLLAQNALPQLKKISFATKFRFQLSGNTIGNALQNMLKGNTSLHQLTLGKIDKHVFAGLSSGYQ